MLLKSLKLSNVRCDESLELSFHKRLTLLVGKNGSGKSTILDAATIAVGTLLAAMDSLPNYGIAKSDARNVCFPLGSTIDVQPQYPVSVSAIGELDGRELRWSRTLNMPNGRTTMSDAKEISAISINYQNRLRHGDSRLLLPIISYYGTGRLWAQHKEKVLDVFSVNTRVNGYLDCLDGAANNKLMLRWFQKMALQSLQQQRELPEFTAVKKAMEQCFQRITGYEDVRVQYNLDTLALDVLYTDDQGHPIRIPVDQLSDGYKCTISLIADIAYRMAILNPQLLDKVTEETNGVVLIDEIDLHLHPAWQQRIIGDLLDIFPRVQFIMSTHAPSVIQTVQSDNLIILDSGGVTAPTGEVYGKDTNTITQSIMGVSDRPEGIKTLLQAFYSNITAQDIPGAVTALEVLKNRLKGDDPELAACQAKLKLLELRRR